MKNHLSDFNTVRTWCELSKSALEHNIRQINQALPHRTEMMAIVKANAYGHGATWVAEQALAVGCKYLAVATLEEAIQLRQAGIEAPILLLSPYHQGFAKYLIGHKITQTIASDYDAAILAQDLAQQNKLLSEGIEPDLLKVHLKIDTGMNRIGFGCRADTSVATVNSIVKILDNPNWDVEGIFTHFSVADEPEKDFTMTQFKRFLNMIEQLKEKNITFRIKHCSNSSAAVFFPEVALDFVRLGISIYGWCPNSEIKDKLKLKPVMSMFSRVSSMHNTSANDPVGYGMTYTTDKETVIGTIEAGYADGINRHLSNQGTFMVNGHVVPVIGRVCMDRTMLDLTDVHDVKVGDPVLIFGNDEQGNYRDLDDLAEQAGTISYEILCGISERVPKIKID